ncbi:hypothetical protein [Calothrix sp. 336/3]|uniref:hypothetical protein n=1 Tax=Calothrix sp. 336/3 TaxID=1337936 RepID=UPI0011876975|nr:hypothetical protein [Calothrix sp. 336/3]
MSLDDLKPSVLLAHELVNAKIPVDKITFALCRVGDRRNRNQGTQPLIEDNAQKGSTPYEIKGFSIKY